jgi:hypothetical protein
VTPPAGNARRRSVDAVQNRDREEEIMNIDVTALQTMPELAAAPTGLRPKQCKTATDVKCAWWPVGTCVYTRVVVK